MVSTIENIDSRFKIPIGDSIDNYGEIKEYKRKAETLLKDFCDLSDKQALENAFNHQELYEKCFNVLSDGISKITDIEPDLIKKEWLYRVELIGKIIAGVGVIVAIIYTIYKII